MSRAQGKRNRKNRVDELKEWHERRIRHCKKCGLAIVWFKTKRGGYMPIVASSVVASDTTLNLTWHRKHTCKKIADTSGK